MMESTPLVSVGSIVKVKPHMNSHGGKKGVVTKLTQSGKMVRVRLQGCSTERTMLISSVECAIVKGFGLRQTAQVPLMTPELKDRLTEQFDEFKAASHAVSMKQREFRPPTWLGEVADEVARTPLSFAVRHQRQMQEREAKLAETTRAIMSKKKPKEPAQTQDDPMMLRSWEHASQFLQQRLANGSRKDDEALAIALDSTVGLLANRDGVDSLVENGIKPLLAMAESQYVEIQRDAAAALYSLSINDDNKIKFLKTKALATLVKMAKSTDLDIRMYLSGAMYRLAMEPEIKRPFVHENVLIPLVDFILNSPSSGIGRDVQRHAVWAIKELVENRENRREVLDYDCDLLKAIFEALKHPDGRVRYCATYSLDSLATYVENKTKMLDAGCLGRLINLIKQKSKDGTLRRAAALCLKKLLDFDAVEATGALVDEKYIREFSSVDTLQALLGVVATERTDLDTLLFVVQTLQAILQAAGSYQATVRKRTFELEGLRIVLEQLERLSSAETPTAAIVEAQKGFLAYLTLLLKTASKAVLLDIFNMGQITTILTLCKSSRKGVRRSGARILARLSTLEESKLRMAQEPETVPLVLAMAKLSDYSTQSTAAKTLAELCEAPSNRLLLGELRVLPTMVDLIQQGDSQIQFDCVRGIADLSEAVDNRLEITFLCLAEIVNLLESEEENVQKKCDPCMCKSCCSRWSSFRCGHSWRRRAIWCTSTAKFCAVNRRGHGTIEDRRG